MKVDRYAMIIIAVLCVSACDRGAAGGAAEVEISGDSLVMIEPDAEGLFMPLRAQAHLSDGSLLADIGNAIDHFDATGKFVRRVGRDGGGPGEFRRISTILTLPGDTLFAAVDARRARIVIFETATGTLRREVAVSPFFPGQQWRWYGDTVVFASKLSATPFTSWVPSTDSIWSWGTVPEIYTKSITAYSQGGEPSVVRRGGGWLAVYPGDGRVFALTREGAFQRAIEIPKTRRRGVPPDLADSVKAIQASGLFRYSASLVFALWELPNGNYALVHMDTDPELNAASYAASSGAGGITYRNTNYWVTFLSKDLARACPDIRVPFEPENMIVPYFSADSLFFLTRSVATDSTAHAVLHRFRLDDSRCDWVATSVSFLTP